MNKRIKNNAAVPAAVPAGVPAMLRAAAATAAAAASRPRVRLKRLVFISVFLLTFAAPAFSAQAQTFVPFRFSFGAESAQTTDDVAVTIQILLILTVLSLAPSILIMMTSFVRTIIVLSFVRNAIGTQQMPPNQVIVSLALFLTFFTMLPVFTQLNDEAIQPYIREEVTLEQAATSASDTMKGFMLKQFGENDQKSLELFVGLAKLPTPLRAQDLPMTVVIPAFLINELTKAFQIGFFIYIPFLVIDMVVASTLMSMGMMMLPPVMISLPFKVLLFISIDGWSLVAETIVKSFK
ncbi:MAG: flagellar type III secretion system pore protein FliP [Clostridiales bacterium]|jgi:flagellar biosynthetic protein FliP|nr:flagellar type III secretion system pore protein FliP [Clostridiales bacterium]